MQYFGSNIVEDVSESWVEADMSWVEVDRAGWSWVKMDGGGWRWVHSLIIPITFFKKKGLKKISNIEISEKRFKILLDLGSESFLFLNTPCFNNTIGIMQC